MRRRRSGRGVRRMLSGAWEMICVSGGGLRGGAFTADGVRRIRQVDSFLCEITQENKHNLKRQPQVAVNYSCLFIICS